MEISVFVVTISVLVFSNYVLCIMHNGYKNFTKSESNIVFPETHKNELQEIPLNLIRRLNEISSMEEFFKTMIDHDEPESTGIAERIGFESIERNALRSAKRAKCMPELTTVQLQPEKTAGIMYYPSCTRVQRCGGCCLHELFSCQPVETEIIPMTVAVSEYRGGHQLHIKEIKIVEVEQHTRCQCDCKIRPKDCTKYQRYSSDKCKCECTNTDKEKKCYKEAPKKLWNPDTCSCECREEQECGSGFEFDLFSCNCIPIRGRRKPSFIYEIN